MCRRLLALLIGAALLSGCGFLNDGCANLPRATYPSPDGRLKAIVFVRDCGATTDFSTQVSLLPTEATLPSESGNIFIADTDHGAVPSTLEGGPEVRVRWTAPRTLEIQHHPKARIFRANRTFTVSSDLLHRENVTMTHLFK